MKKLLLYTILLLVFIIVCEMGIFFYISTNSKTINNQLANQDGINKEQSLVINELTDLSLYKKGILETAEIDYSYQGKIFNHVQPNEKNKHGKLVIINNQDKYTFFYNGKYLSQPNIVYDKNGKSISMNELKVDDQISINYSLNLMEADANKQTKKFKIVKLNDL